MRVILKRDLGGEQVGCMIDDYSWSVCSHIDSECIDSEGGCGVVFTFPNLKYP